MRLRCFVSKMTKSQGPMSKLGFIMWDLIGHWTLVIEIFKKYYE
jgi:hypothetical protein